MSNEFDAAVTTALQPDTAQSARVGFSAASDTNPDAYAEAKRVARRTGVPVDTVFAMPNEIKRQDAIGSIDFDTLAKTSPSTAALLADVEKAKVAHDDVPGIGEIERKLRQFGGGAVEAVGMAASGTGRLLDVAQRSAAGWAGLMLPEPMAGGSPTLDSLAGPMIGEGWQGAGKIVKNTARNDIMVPAAQQTFGDQVAGGLGQVAAQILMLPFTRGAGLYAQGADVIGEKIDGDNAPQWKKDLATVGGAGITGITEKWALDKLLGPMVVPVKNVIAASLARIGIAATAEGGQEFSENVLHDSLRKMMTNSEAKIDFGQAGQEAGVGAAVGGIVRTVIEAGLHIKSRGQQAQQATQMGELLTGLNTMAEASKLVQRDSETAQGFFQSILDEGRDAVYISPEALAQSGLAEQMAQSIPAVAEQLGTAAEAGHDIRIPIADLMATMAGPELEQSLLPHVAVEPGGFTQTTAQEYLQSDQAKELQAEVDRVLGEKEGDDTFKASAQAVKTTVKDQLTTAGRFTESVNDAYASMMGNFFAVQAARMGTTPEEMFKRYPLRIGAESIAGQQFDQGRTLQQLRDDLQKQQAGFDAYDAEIRGGVDPDGDKYFGLADKVTEAMDAFVADLEQIPDDSFSLQAKTKDGRMLLVNPSAQKPGHYQLTRFASDGNPWGDTQYPTKKQAIKDFLDESDASTVKDFGGQLNQSARLNTDTPEFRNWFGDSAVVDSDGKPLRVFHGTASDITAFDIGRSGESTGNTGFYGAGAYFSEDADYASGFSFWARRSDDQAPNVVPVYLSLKNPAYINITPRSQAASEKSRATAEKIISTMIARGTDQAVVDKLQGFVSENKFEPFMGTLYNALGGGTGTTALLKEAGFDGVTIYGGISGKEKLAEAVAFDPTQIKAAIGNRGTFDPNDANILNQKDPLDDVFRKYLLIDDSVKQGNDPVEVARLAYPEIADAVDRVVKGNSWEWAVKQAKAHFSRNAVTEARKNGIHRGTFNPATLQLTLLKNADLSTFLHESGHFFLEVQADLAGQLMRDASIHGADTLKPGEQQVVNDMQATLDWFGIKDLSEWNALDFEEKRSYHEKFARGFESYLFEGKAPSIELQGLFQRFRAWMMNVYRDLKALNVELTDEVRGVFDRMLATTEQITLAEQGRSMMPLFTSPEQIGMTPAEFADYQALGTDATNEAIEDLQARGLRDMQWIHNARGRVIKQLQKESAAKRAEVKMGVRADVMSQPIYRAWQFLTGKMTADDQIDPVTPPKSDPNVLDETIDSLFAAIAKLGGINKDDVVKTWGVDPADKPTSGLFGKPLWRVEGGLSIDGMAEALSQYGYLEKDENGKWDIRELEEKFKAELGGDSQFSTAYDYAGNQPVRHGDQVANPMGLAAGRLDRASLTEIGLPVEIIEHLDKLRMVRKDGIHPDIVAEMFGFTSGDELVRRLAAAEAPKAEIEALTDQRMLEQFGDLSSDEAIKKAADKAIHNDVRARLVATELAALEKATGKRTTLASAAKEYAAAMIARLKVRDIKPGQYAAGEVRAAKATEKASKAGDIATAAAEKRNQLINTYATRAAYDAQEEVEKGLRYLKTFDSAGKRKGLDADYTDQIDALLERFDLRKGQSGKAVDKRKALAEWLTAQQDAGLEPDIPQQLVNEAFRKSYKDMTVEELRGLIDTIKQIEHLGRLKHKLLTARDQRAYEAIRDEIAASIVEHAGERKAETRTPDTVLGKSMQKMRNFWAAHIKSAMWARIMDGGKDGGPVWEYFVRAANERGDMETTMRAEATAKLSEILDPVFKLGKMQAKVFFPLINRSLTREARIAIALNVGNASNLQRLQGGEVWTDAQLAPILRTLTAAEWQAVQQVWDHFESYRPQIAAKERRVYGKEPEWIAPTPFTVQTADGQSVQMRGGYYPVKYDPAASQRAEEHADAEGAKRQLQGAYTSATTRRSFTKTRADEVNGRPLLYSLAGVYSGVNDVIHDLSWHEWLIDTNRLLRSQTIDSAIRNHYGPEVKQQFKKWSADIAEGDKASTDSGDIAVNYIRQSVSVAGLGFNVMSAAIQPLGITQSIVRIGAKWVGRGIAKYIAHPIELAREVNSMSSFMENRARTRFRELNELRNQVEGQTKVKEFVGHYAYFLMMRFQQSVDVPTWWGAYEKAVSEGNNDERAVSLADQAVIDAQGGGMLKDQAGIERTGATGKLFTVFYSFMNTAMNMGVAQTMTEKSKAKLVADYALLYLIPPMLGMALKAAITPGDSGDDDPEKIAKKLLAAQIDYMMGMMVYVREFSDVAKTLTGANDMGRDYQGPAGLRLVVDAGKFAKQVGQGEFDDAFRKASVNLIGDLFGLPSAQLNRTITGIKALAEGETENPAAIAFGFQKPR